MDILGMTTPIVNVESKKMTEPESHETRGLESDRFAYRRHQEDTQEIKDPKILKSDMFSYVRPSLDDHSKEIPEDILSWKCNTMVQKYLN